MYEATKTLVDEFAMAAMQGDWASNYSLQPSFTTAWPAR